MTTFRLSERSAWNRWTATVRSIAAVCCLLIGSNSIADPTALTDGEKPNVVWIVLDTLRADHLHCYEYERDTSPNIDALANEGTLFEKNYAQGSNTLLSVPTYITGKYFPAFYQDPFFLDIWLLKSPPDNEIPISRVFSDNGYVTAMFSASPWFTKESRLAKSFQSFGTLDSANELVSSDFRANNPSVFQWMDQHADAPFFLYVHTLDTHQPRGIYNTHTTWLDKSFSQQRDETLRKWKGAPFNRDDQEHIRNLYDGGVSYADYTVGEIVSHLKELGIRDETLIIIASDHGEVLAEDGATLGHDGHHYYDDQLHVPLIFSGNGFPAGKRVPVRTQNIDIVPTLIDCLNLNTDAVVDGQSLVPLLNQSNPLTVHPIIYAKAQDKHITLEPRHILITGDMKFQYRDLFPHPKENGGAASREIEARNVWKYPDYAASRSRFHRTHPLETERVESFLDEVIGPAWRRYDSRPMHVPPFFEFPHAAMYLRNIVSERLDSTDGKWTKIVESVNSTMMTRILYVAYNSTENVPHMRLMRRIPRGSYNLEIFTRSWPVNGIQQPSSFKIRIGAAGSRFIQINLQPESDSEPTRRWMSVGTINIDDEQFYYTIAPWNGTDVSVVGKLRFTQTGREIDSNEVERAIDEHNEVLTTLGYLE